MKKHAMAAAIVAVCAIAPAAEAAAHAEGVFR